MRLVENGEECPPEVTFTRGVNPHESAFARQLPRMKVLEGGHLSVNAYLDIFVGYQVSVAGSNTAIYLKHLTPLFTQNIKSDQSELLQPLVQMNLGRSFGCFVFRGTLTEQCARLILQVPCHTIAAEAFEPEAIAFLMSRDVQRANRGITLVETNISQSILGSVILENDLHSLRLEDRKPALQPGPSKYHRMLKYCRTIATNIYAHDELIYSVCGEFDVTSGLEQALEIVSKNGFKDVDVVTDACFGVKSPISILREYGVRALFTFGEKSSGLDLAEDLRNAGIEFSSHPHRAFAYMP